MWWHSKTKVLKYQSTDVSRTVTASRYVSFSCLFLYTNNKGSTKNIKAVTKEAKIFFLFLTDYFYFNNDCNMVILQLYHLFGNMTKLSNINEIVIFQSNCKVFRLYHCFWILNSLNCNFSIVTLYSSVTQGFRNDLCEQGTRLKANLRCPSSLGRQTVSHNFVMKSLHKLRNNSRNHCLTAQFTIRSTNAD